MKKHKKKIDEKTYKAIAKLQGQQTFVIHEIREIKKTYTVNAKDEFEAYDKLRHHSKDVPTKVLYNGIMDTGKLQDTTRYELEDEKEKKWRIVDSESL